MSRSRSRSPEPMDLTPDNNEFTAAGHRNTLFTTPTTPERAPRPAVIPSAPRKSARQFGLPAGGAAARVLIMPLPVAPTLSRGRP